MVLSIQRMKIILYNIALLLLLLLPGCKKEDEYDILEIRNNPKSDNAKDYPDINDDTIFSKGYNFSILKNNATRFYKLFWIKEGKRRSYDLFETRAKVNAIINNPESDLEIKLPSNRIAFITRTICGFSSDDLVRVQDVWYYSDEKWRPLLNHSNSFYRAYLLYLNDDNFIDIIIQGGCCDHLKFSIYLGDSNNNFKYIQDIVINGIPKIEFNKKCDNQIKVRHFDIFKFYYTKSVYFNCEKNMFIFNWVTFYI